MGLFDIFFPKKKGVGKEESPLYKHEQLLIQRVIDLLRENPEDFSSTWFDSDSVGSSVESKDRKILVMIESGHIIRPTKPNLTDDQISTIKELIKPIVERDSKRVIDKVVGSHAEGNY